MRAYQKSRKIGYLWVKLRK